MFPQNCMYIAVLACPSIQSRRFLVAHALERSKYELYIPRTSFVLQQDTTGKEDKATAIVAKALGIPLSLIPKEISTVLQVMLPYILTY